MSYPVKSFVFKRNASFFGNIGQTMNKIVPKPHKYFKITKPIGLETAPIRTQEVKRGPIFTLENLNFPKRIWNFYFDGITRRTRVESIQKELAYGGMYDFHVYMKTKGRLFEAPISFFRREKALYFSNFRAKTLNGNRVEFLDVLDKAKVSIVRIYSTDAGFESTSDYFKVPSSEDNYLTKTGLATFNQEFPKAQIVELMLSENASKHFVHTFVTPGKLSKERPKEQHDRYLIAMRDAALPRDDREKLLMTNAYSGYVYVLDDSYKVRWAGSGWPKPEEVKGLWQAVRGIQKESVLKTVKTNK